MNTLIAQTDQSQSLRLRIGDEVTAANTCLYELGKPSFGRYGDAARQSAKIRSVVRDRLVAKAKRPASGA